jgi:hypothetical protein
MPTGEFRAATHIDDMRSAYAYTDWNALTHTYSKGYCHTQASPDAGPEAITSRWSKILIRSLPASS